MSRSGGHRVRSLARWVTIPLLIAVLAFVGYATFSGAQLLLRIAAVTAAVAAVVGVSLFDAELIRSRRRHGADRATLAKSYAETYAAHIRVTSAVTEARADTEGAQTPAAAAETSQPASAGAAAATNGKSAALLAAERRAGLDGSQADAPELWAQLGDAPTVVDLIAWEERARLAKASAEPESASVTSAEATEAAAAESSGKARTA